MADVGATPDDPQGKRGGSDPSPIMHVPAIKLEKLFRLLDLPAEIRIMIYRECLVAPITWHFSNKYFSDTHPEPPLTLSNKQLRLVTLPIYYGQNTLGIQIHELKLPGRRDSTGLQEAHEARRNFHHFIDEFIAGSTDNPATSRLQFVKNLRVVYYHPYDRSMLNTHRFHRYAYEFRMCCDVQCRMESSANSNHQGSIHNHTLRTEQGGIGNSSGKVGHAQTDWKCLTAVSVALQDTMKEVYMPFLPRSPGLEYQKLEDVSPSNPLMGILWRCAKECSDATGRVTFSWAIRRRQYAEPRHYLAVLQRELQYISWEF